MSLGLWAHLEVVKNDVDVSGGTNGLSQGLLDLVHLTYLIAYVVQDLQPCELGLVSWNGALWGETGLSN